MRLDEYVTRAFSLENVKKSQKLIRDGRVRVCGRTIQQCAWNIVLNTVEEDSAEILPKPQEAAASEEENGEENNVEYTKRKLKHALILVNKPVNHVCMRFDFDFLKEEEEEEEEEERAFASSAADSGSSLVAADSVSSKDTSARSRAIAGHKKRGTRSTYDVLPDRYAKHPKMGIFGRLDKDTTGLIFFGTDGGLQDLLLHPLSKCTKVYEAGLVLQPFKRMRASAPDEFREGLVMWKNSKCKGKERTCLPATLEMLETREVPWIQAELVAREREERMKKDAAAAENDSHLRKRKRTKDDTVGREKETTREEATVAPPDPTVASRIRVTLKEGKYHQVKRMVAACGGCVRTLDRVAIGSFRLEDYPDLAARRGTFRVFGRKDMEKFRISISAARRAITESRDPRHKKRKRP
eukprot:g4242.t1